VCNSTPIKTQNPKTNLKSHIEGVQLHTLHNAKMIVEGGDHDFVGIERHFKMIDYFLNEPKVDSKL